MNIYLISLVLLIFSPFNSKASTKVRHVEVKKDQIVIVKTALGIATIIEVPDRPTSVVVGDQDSFKVEYLDQAITIKPLVPGAKSNLYVYTDGERFNVELNTGGESLSDYVVYLDYPRKPANRKNSSIKWTNFTNHLKNDGLELIVKRLGRVSGDLLVVEFVLTAKEKLDFKPEWLWLTQDGEMIPVNNLNLSGLRLDPEVQIHGSFQILKSDLDVEKSFRVELRRKRLSYLTIKKVKEWKRL